MKKSRQSTDIDLDILGGNSEGLTLSSTECKELLAALETVLPNTYGERKEVLRDLYAKLTEYSMRRLK